MRPTRARARISLALIHLSLLALTLSSTSTALAQQTAIEEEAFVELIRTGDIEAATQQFRAFRAANPDGQLFRATTLNGLG